GEEGAVSKASGELLAGVPTILFVHIIASILTIVGYVVATWSGFRLHRRGIGRRLHRANAWAFVVVRLVTYSTSFFV
ncbi:MAG TPA: hypothetical protein VK116_18750, partial [Planctomycetota bacterium]|nr:hypothetical protein [Planctomycetota bacterium]